MKQRRSPDSSFTSRSLRAGLILATVLVSSSVPSSVAKGLVSIDPQAARWESPPIDVPRLIAEDETDRREGKQPWRVGYPLKVDLSPAGSGSWSDLADGGRLWQLRVHSAGALWLVLGFDTFRLQAGGRLLAHAPGASPLGPLDHTDVRGHGQLWLPPVEGDTMVVELYWPAELRGVEPDLHLGTVSHGYREWGAFGSREGGGEISTRDHGPGPSGFCNVDVNCPLGSDWQDEKRSVVRLLSGGSAFCTGVLVNNSANDCAPLVLTSAQCVNDVSTAAGTLFQFNYEHAGCESGTVTTDQTIAGSTLVATHDASDFTLLRMDSDPPDLFGAFFAGWSRSAVAPNEGWCIHHPLGDVKKISRNGDPLIDGVTWGIDYWRVTEWEQGTTEPGSSGAPLFDENHRIVGQLRGGPSSCIDDSYDEFGKLGSSWTGGATPASRLSDWLDPLAGGAVTLGGWEGVFCSVPQPKLIFTGSVVDDAPGNGDGVVDTGETFELRASLENAGNLGATGISATLSAITPLVDVSTNVATWSDLPIGVTGESNAPHYTVSLHPDFRCGDSILFQLDATANEQPGARTSRFSIGTGTPSFSPIFSDDMEIGLNGWSTLELSGANPWAQTTNRSNSPTTSWFVGNVDSVGDSVLVMPTQLGLPAGAELRFAHFIRSETDFDGGVLEYTTDGGTWIDAGPLMTEGGYNGTIDPDNGSPLAGRSAWSGDLGGWQAVVVDLSGLAGADVTLRWRFATDSSVLDEGWYLDDVVLDSTTFACALLLPGEASAPGSGGASFRIDRSGPDFALNWSTPPTGGPPQDYVLYATPLGALGSEPQCDGDLGSGNSAIRLALPDDSAFIVVARNAIGEGSYGRDSGGAPRLQASGNICP